MCSKVSITGDRPPCKQNTCGARHPAFKPYKPLRWVANSLVPKDAYQNGMAVSGHNSCHDVKGKFDAGMLNKIQITISLRMLDVSISAEI